MTGASGAGGRDAERGPIVGERGHRGTVEQGKVADLILVDAPTVDAPTVDAPTVDAFLTDLSANRVVGVVRKGHLVIGDS